MDSGGKREFVCNSMNTSERKRKSHSIMSPERKRPRKEKANNNMYKLDEEENTTHLSEMGVSVLPSSDCEDSASDSETAIQVHSDKSDESSRDSMIHNSPTDNIRASETAMVTPPEQILSFRPRRSIKSTSKIDPFMQLSDEIILMILSWLPRGSLGECARVCQRWRRVSYDESLWQRIDLTSAVLRPDNTGHVLQRQPIILRMAQAEVVTPMFEELAPALEDFVCQVQFLDLSMALIKESDLAVLLGKCRNLKKLSLEHCTTDSAVCSSIALNPDLEVLNMSQCYKLNATGLEEILINCSELVELNLAWTKLDSICIDIVCKLVNENIRQLNISGCHKWMKDSHVMELVSRCTCLTVLDLSDCTDLSEQCLEPIVKHLCDIKELSFSRCYGTLPPSYLKLSKLKSLRFLNLFGLMQPKQLDVFREEFKFVQINRHEFSTVARPTVGIRRTSIWGLRVRD